MVTQAREGHYFKVLERQTRILGDYEQVHFRRSSIAPQPPRHNSSQISIAPRRPTRPQYVNFNKSTAALYLRQTEGLWMNPDLTRQEATVLLLDRPIGSFVVRSSQRAKYALSLRILTDASEETAVTHFLITLNKQNFLTIQGSHLPFLSIYDLLVYFCFHQSGGMPCCLKPPEPDGRDIKPEGSDSSDSDSEADSADPPALPPRTASMVTIGSSSSGGGDDGGSGGDGGSAQEPSTIGHRERVQGINEKDMVLVIPKKKAPPPKPPRPTEFLDWDDSEEEEEGGERGGKVAKGTEELTLPAKRVVMVTDGDIGKHAPTTTTTTIKSKPLTSPGSGRQVTHIPRPPLLRKRSKSSECIRERRRKIQEMRSRLDSTPHSAGAQDSVKKKVSSLIEMFESKSPSTSPKMRGWNNRKGSSSVPLSTKASHTITSNSITSNSSTNTTTSTAGSRGTTRSSGSSSGTDVNINSEEMRFPSRSSNDAPPPPPPKPKLEIPLLPPRPLSTDLIKGEVPVIPPRTPAPLLPPKPPGSRPPSILPRTSSVHRRSLSDTNPKYDLVPPKIPPKMRPRIPGYETMPMPKRYSPSYLTAGGGGGVNPDDSESDPLENSSKEASIELKESKSEGEGEGEWSKIEALQRGEGKDESGCVGDNLFIAEIDVTTRGWQLVSNEVTSDQVESIAGNKGGTKWRAKPLGWAKKLQFRHGKRKPRKRLRKFIIDLSADPSQEFGLKISDFITEMRSRNTEPHQKMLTEIRSFITAMHEHLLQHHQNDLKNCGIDSCDNSGHVVECALQECILQPLSHFVYLRIEEFYATNGHLYQVQRSIHQGKLKSPEEMGIRPHLLAPPEKAIADMITVFNRMMKTSCAISKLEYLLEVVRLTYENIRDSRQPKKPMNDLGADDFLPIFVWVLVQCEFTRAEIEAEYMWGLAHPSLFNGEGGYYLTTLTSAINVLKELTTSQQEQPQLQQQLPPMNNLQTELKVFFEDEHTGQYSSAYYLPIVPTMTAAEICEIIEERRQIACPDSYALFAVVDGKASILKDQERPQEIKLKWTLQRSLEQSLVGKGQGSSNQFFAYKLRTLQDTVFTVS